MRLPRRILQDVSLDSYSFQPPICCNQVLICYKYFEYYKTFKSTNIVNMKKKIVNERIYSSVSSASVIFT